jgi:hypothetical protein
LDQKKNKRRYMKRILLVVVAFAALNLDAGAWAALGHAVSAKIAEDHLTPAAKSAVKECLGNLSIVAVASDADIYRGQWTYDIGFMPTNPIEKLRPKYVDEINRDLPVNIQHYCHIYRVDENCKPYTTNNFDGYYRGNTILDIDNLSKELEGWKTLDPERRKIVLSLIVHLVADIHCPDHIAYQPENSTGSFEITFKKKKTTRHAMWDSELLASIIPWSYSDAASLIDTADAAYISEITKGDVYDWGYDSALMCRIAHEVKAGANVPRSYAADMRELAFTQLRNGGYRLAALLNRIFEE